MEIQGHREQPQALKLERFQTSANDLSYLYLCIICSRFLQDFHTDCKATHQLKHSLQHLLFTIDSVNQKAKSINYWSFGTCGGFTCASSDTDLVTFLPFLKADRQQITAGTPQLCSTSTKVHRGQLCSTFAQ